MKCQLSGSWLFSPTLGYEKVRDIASTLGKDPKYIYLNIRRTKGDKVSLDFALTVNRKLDHQKFREFVNTTSAKLKAEAGEGEALIAWDISYSSEIVKMEFLGSTKKPVSSGNRIAMKP